MKFSLISKADGDKIATYILEIIASFQEEQFANNYFVSCNCWTERDSFCGVREHLDLAISKQHFV